MFKLVCNIINSIELVIGKIATVVTALISGIIAGVVGWTALLVWLEIKKPGSMSGILRDVNDKEEEPQKETPKKPRIVRAKRTKKGGE
jgi:MFS superfamily sulfate permease-like transporter